ncbi:hypothetical protein SOCE26_007110 [Sorangium cellulosum]|uniref:Uncharacterized protein n=1 Tax=Sorangium cellulosum TaxID=56 RepID=A0A2L0EJ52_SORCE|nr:hypothetical protein [Sorangium cellulosum]AUX39322.1 hypothetical protein SOCE26_007110 [Sorangium cellulosum]
MNRTAHLGAFMTVLSLAACGGEGSDAAPTDTAMSSKQLKDLTADDVQSTCDSLEARVKLSKEDACEYWGLIAAPALEKPCATLKDECVSAPDAEAQGQGADASCMPSTDQRAGCTATVAEYEVCLVAQTEIVRALTCDSEISTLEAAVPECEEVMRKCPQLLPEDAGGGEGQ